MDMANDGNYRELRWYGVLFMWDVSFCMHSSFISQSVFLPLLGKHHSLIPFVALVLRIRAYVNIAARDNTIWNHHPNSGFQVGLALTHLKSTLRASLVMGVGCECVWGCGMLVLLWMFVATAVVTTFLLLMGLFLLSLLLNTTFSTS
jgi:hypothetical protein